MKLIDKDALVAEIERQISAIDNYPKHTDTLNIQIAVLEGNKVVLTKLLSFLDTLEVKEVQEEPVSEDLEKAASRYAKEEYNHKSHATLPDRCRGCYAPLMYAFKAGAEWDKEQAEIQIKAQSMALPHGCPKEKPISEELEEAANSYIDNWYKLNNLDKKSYTIDVEISKNDFKAGALWQKEHCLKELMISDLETAADKYAIKIYNMFIKDETTLNNKEGDEILSDAFKAGAKWQKENLWKPADGDDLPEIDREVIALIQDENDAWITKVVFAHRPPEYWDGKNIITNEVTRYYPKRYDKGNWNIPNVKFWLDLDLPKMEGGDV